MTPEPGSEARHLPLSAAVLAILLALAEGEKHGYAIMKEAALPAGGGVTLGPGTPMYGTIDRLIRDVLVEETGFYRRYPPPLLSPHPVRAPRPRRRDRTPQRSPHYRSRPHRPNSRTPGSPRMNPPDPILLSLYRSALGLYPARLALPLQRPDPPVDP